MEDAELPAPPPTRAEKAAWVLYDWANSAYSTLLITVVVKYVQDVLFEGRVGAAVYAWAIGLAALVTALLSPILGAWADATCNKRGLLAATALGGAAMALLMAALPPSAPWAVIAALVLMSVLFDLSFVPYNGFLPELASGAEIDRLSAWGFALGYLGGALPLVAAGFLVTFGPALGLPSAAAQLRAGIVLLGLWWGLFSLPCVGLLRDRRRPRGPRPGLRSAARRSFGEVVRTLSHVRRLPVLAWFLLAFLLFNDGVQTVITQATSIANQQLHFEAGELFLLVLVIQLVAMPGALLVGWLSQRWGRRPTLLACLAVWMGLVVGAATVQTRIGFWILGCTLALVLGGTQSVSRAMMGTLTPAAREAEFFGFFNLTGKAFSWIGPWLFGAILLATGSTAIAAVSLLPLFVAGAAIVARLDFAEGQRQAKLPFSQPP